MYSTGLVYVQNFKMRRRISKKIFMEKKNLRMMRKIRTLKKNGKHIGELSAMNVSKFFHSSPNLINILGLHMRRNLCILVHTVTKQWKNIPLLDLIVTDM